MRTSALILIGLFGFTVPTCSFAIDPGTATGTLKIDNDSVTLTHAYAHLHDNAEGWLDTPKEMRILAADREVDQEALSGMNPFFTLSYMVRQGSVRGVLLRFDPGKPNTIIATVLYPPKDQKYALTNKKLSDREKSPLKKLIISDVRVSASLNQSTDGNQELGWPAVSYNFSFSAPLFKEPAVTATMKGKQALNSPQAKAVLAKAAAMAKGDLDKVKQLSTERMIRQIDMSMSQMSQEEAKNMMRESGLETERSVKKGKLRLIVRGDRASLIVEEKDGNVMFGFIRGNGNWIVD